MPHAAEYLLAFPTNVSNAVRIVSTKLGGDDLATLGLDLRYEVVSLGETSMKPVQIITRRDRIRSDSNMITCTRTRRALTHFTYYLLLERAPAFLAASSACFFSWHASVLVAVSFFGIGVNSGLQQILASSPH